MFVNFKVFSYASPITLVSASLGIIPRLFWIGSELTLNGTCLNVGPYSFAAPFFLAVVLACPSFSCSTI